MVSIVHLPFSYLARLRFLKARVVGKTKSRPK